MNFINFRNAVNTQINSMANMTLFRVANSEDLREVYLKTIPVEHNPIYKTEPTYKCDCCLAFIKHIGNMIGIDADMNIHTIWDINVDDEFQNVANTLASIVRSAPIKSVYKHYEQSVGAKTTFTNFDKVGGVISNEGKAPSFSHLYANVPASGFMQQHKIAKYLGEIKANYDVLKRTFTEHKIEAYETVLELIGSNNLYRGEEFENPVRCMYNILKENGYQEHGDKYLWVKALQLGNNAKFRNSAIGTLVTDLSDGMDLEQAVRLFESKVAPENYKRTSAIITPRMLAEANAKVEELGIESALPRRYAKLEDVTINNVLFADRSIQTESGYLTSILEDSTTKKADEAPKKTTEISIDDFIKDVLPKANTIEALVENYQMNNLVSLIAPVHNDSKNILKWNNNFSWSYAGNITDASIKQAVAHHGGKTEGTLRVSLAWHNSDDLDIYVEKFRSGTVYYGNKREFGAELDIDMNVGAVPGHGVDHKNPIENIVWPKDISDGKYKVYVRNACVRNECKNNNGFKVELAYGDKSLIYSSEINPCSGNSLSQITVVEFTVKNGQISEITGHLPEENTPKDVWSIKTKTYQKVNAIMYSPNHWDDNKVGNKHFFFMLQGCKNPSDCTGIYNEFLIPELHDHRKVFEVLGSKLKAPYTDNQISGLGFSSTKRADLVVRVKGEVNRVFTIKF